MYSCRRPARDAERKADLAADRAGPYLRQRVDLLPATSFSNGVMTLFLAAVHAALMASGVPARSPQVRAGGLPGIDPLGAAENRPTDRALDSCDGCRDQRLIGTKCRVSSDVLIWVTGPEISALTQ